MSIETIMNWYDEHEEEIKIAATIGLGVATAVGTVYVFKKMSKALNDFALNDFPNLKSDPNPALWAANNNSFRHSCGVSDNDILFQNIVSKNLDYFDTEVVSGIAKEIENVPSAFNDYYQKLVDRIGIDAIENITVIYDIAKETV